MSNAHTSIIKQGQDYFIANTEDGRIRFGLLNTASIDTPIQHQIDRIMALLDADNFDEAADDLFGDLWGETRVAA